MREQEPQIPQTNPETFENQIPVSEMAESRNVGLMDRIRQSRLAVPLATVATIGAGFAASGARAENHDSGPQGQDKIMVEKKKDFQVNKLSTLVISAANKHTSNEFGQTGVLSDLHYWTISNDDIKLKVNVGKSGYIRSNGKTRCTKEKDVYDMKGYFIKGSKLDSFNCGGKNFDDGIIFNPEGFQGTLTSVINGRIVRDTNLKRSRLGIVKKVKLNERKGSASVKYKQNSSQTYSSIKFKQSKSGETEISTR